MIYILYNNQIYLITHLLKIIIVYYIIFMCVYTIRLIYERLNTCGLRDLLKFNECNGLISVYPIRLYYTCSRYIICIRLYSDTVIKSN